MFRSAWLWLVVALVCRSASAGLEEEMRAIGTLCAATNHEAAIEAYVALADTREDPMDRYEVISAAARCARLQLGSESRALALCERIGEEPYIKGCRAMVYQWTGTPSNVVADLGNENLTEWPETLAAVGFSVRGAAYYNLNMPTNALQDFVRAFQCCTGMEKWNALERLGDTYRNLLDDELLAEACYRKCMGDCIGGWPGLRARVNLGELLLSQKRYDAALECLRGTSLTGGYWKAALAEVEARVLAEMGKTDEAVAVLDQILAMPGIQSSQTANAEKMLGELRE